MATGSGSPQAQSSTVAGLSERQINGTSALQAQSSSTSGVSENKIPGSGTLQPTTNNLVAGVSERQINGTSALQAQASTVAGVSEREVADGTGALQSSQPTLTSTIERTITGSGVLQDSQSTLTSTIERTITGSGVLNDNDVNVLGGAGERIVPMLIEDTSGQFRPTVSNLVTGDAERIHPGNGALKPTNNNVVAGVSERVITAEGDLQSDESVVTATSENKINGSGSLQDSVSVVAGVSERIVVGVEADLTADEVGIVAITGDAERVITASGSLESQDPTVTFDVSTTRVATGTLQPSENNVVAGVAERVIPAETITLNPTDNNVVAGVSEREIRSAVTIALDSSTVTGVAEKTIVASGSLVVQATLFPFTGFAERSITGSGAATQTSNSVVVGVGENEVVSEAGAAHAGLSSVSGAGAVGRPASGTLSDGASVVAGVSERVIVSVEADLTADEVGVSSVEGAGENEHPGSGTLQAQSSTVASVSENKIPGSGTLHPTTNNLVAGVSERVITASGSLDTGTSSVSGSGVRTSNGLGDLQTNSSVVVGSAELLKIGNGALQTGVSTVSGSGVRTSNGTGTIENVDSVVVGVSERTIVGSGDLVPSTDSRVVGVSERETVAGTGAVLDTLSIVTASAFIGRLTTPELDTTSSLVDGLSERTVVLQSGIEQAQPSTVSGISERIITGSGTLVDDSSTVSGVSERTINASGTLQAQPSKVAGISERTVVLQSGIEQVDPSVVAGVAERVIPAETITLNPTDNNVVAGVSERVITGAGDLVVPDVSKVVGVAERTINVSGINMPDDDSKVTGLAERIIGKPFFADPIQGDPSVVDGLAERIVENNNITLQVIAQPSKVAGVAERQIDLISGIEQVDPSVVSGIAERTINGTGATQTTDSVIVGISERIVVLQSGIEQVDTSVVSGIAERTINGISGIDMPDDDSKIVGVSERVITGSGTLVDDSSTVSGVSERTINASGTLQAQVSVVAGISERIIENNEITQALKPTDNNIVAGISERIVVLQSGIEQVETSVVSGIAERIVVDVDATPKAQESRIVGVAERQIDLISGIDMPDDDSKVVGVAEREVENNELEQALKPTDNNLVTGVAERIINLFESPKAQDARIADQEPDPIVIIRHPIGGTEYPEYRSDLYAGDAQPTLDADRVHTQETDGESTKLKFGPNSSDPNVVYVNPKYLRLQGNSDPLNDGIYDLLDTGFTCSVSSGNDLTLATNKNYNVYYRKVGYQDYRVCMFRTTNLTWVAFQTTLNPELFFSHGTVITNGQLNGELIASTSQSRGGPYKIMRPTLYNLVVGDADRVSDINNITPVLKPSEHNIVEGVAVRKVKPFDGTIHADPSRVVGLGERTLNNDGLGQQVASGPSTVVGDVERIVVGSGVVVSGQSSLGGLAENQIDLEEGIAQVDESTVSGSGVRTANVLDGIEPIDNLVNGVAERTVVGSGTPQGDESTVNGYGPRTSNGIGVLVSDISEIYGGGENIILNIGHPNLKASSSTVDATTKRTVKGVDGTVASDPSTANGVGARHSIGSGDLLDEHDHLVDGVAERVITATGSLETEDCQVVGEAHKIVRIVQGIAQVSSSKVVGVAERSITVEAELQAGDSRVEAMVYTNNTEQQAMHVQRAFRIRKPHTRRIIVRQTPTNRL